MASRTRITLFCLQALLAVSLPVCTAAMEPDVLRAEAMRYEHGTGIEQNYAHAYALYCIAALQGDGESAYRLGWMYLTGRGMPQDPDLASGWFQLAAERGDIQSQHVLEDLLTEASAEEDDKCPRDTGAPDSSTIDTWVRALSPGYGIDADLVLALIEVESRFDAHARSSKNARGLMQLLPSTAKRFDVKDIWDPAQNLMGGMAYLRWLLDYFDGDLDRSLAAYNAGEEAVERYRGIPPYRETRDYVRKIKQLYSGNRQS